ILLQVMHRPRQLFFDVLIAAHQRFNLIFVGRSCVEFDGECEREAANGEKRNRIMKISHELRTKALITFPRVIRLPLSRADKTNRAFGSIKVRLSNRLPTRGYVTLRPALWAEWTGLLYCQPSLA